jgi:hypothetical protein
MRSSDQLPQILGAMEAPVDLDKPADNGKKIR